MICAACGTENRAGSRFCDSCGAGLTAACPQCGEANRVDARFCASCGQVLAATDATAAADGPRTQPAEAERRLVTVLFTDLVGFTSLAEDRDPEAVRELLSAYFDNATRIVQLHGGIVEKFIGDAVMAVWGTPVAHEDDAERAVRAALEMVDAVKALHPDLQARAGVLTGDAAVTLNARNQGMVAGDLVNTAARLQGVAEPGTVLVGEATRRAAEGAIVFEDIGDHSLKGKTSPVPAWRALRVVANRGGQSRADVLEPPFVGREEELRELKDVLHAAGRDRWVRLVSITGPGGIGKSRLVWELEKYVDGVAEDIYWHRGRSPSYGEGIALWALGEMVRRRCDLTEDADESATRAAVATTLAEYVPDASERERIGPALLTLLGVEEAPAGGRDALYPAWRLFFERIAERGTVVLVFEDLQWADTGLLDFIEHLLDWSRGLPILVIALARPELFDRRTDWASNRRHLTALALEPLEDGEVRRLLEGLVPGLPADALATIVARAEGMPLYAVEMVRGLLSDRRIERRGDAYVPTGDLSTITVPESLRSLIASRLDGLDPSDRSLLQDAAVLGEVFATDALVAVSGVASDNLEARLRDLVRRELLDIERDPRSPERGQHKFVQSLIREVAYGTLARRDRRTRHLAAARHYEALAEDERAGALASHYLAAREASDPGPEAEAITAQARLALTGAADRAASLGGYDQAVAYLDQALAISSDLVDRAPLLDRAAEAANIAARESEHYAQEAIDAYRHLGDARAAQAATVQLGKQLIQGGQVARATEILEAALAEAEAMGDEPALAETLANLSRAYMRAGSREPAMDAADRSLAIAERLNLEPIVAEALENKASALNQLGRRRESIALHESVVQMAVRLPDRVFEMRARNNMAAALGDDEPVRATQLTVDSMEMAREIGVRGMYNWLVAMVALGLRSAGDTWDEHLERMREALDTASVRSDRVRLRALIAGFELARGDGLDEIGPEMKEMVGDSTDPDDRFALLITIAYASLMSGDPDTAYAVALEAGALQSQNAEGARGLALRAAVWARDPDRMRAAAATVADSPSTGAVSQAFRAAAAGAVAFADGRTSDALDALRDSVARLTKLGLRMEAAEMAVDAAILLPADPEVRRMAAEHRPLLEELRARPILERLDAALASVPATSRAAAAIPVESPSRPAG
jgi:class 3 adenylate cyclase/tetratricopeptide (TPR) repeat protein